MSRLAVPIALLRARGIEVFPRGGSDHVDLPPRGRIEAPSSLKWTDYEHSIELGAFSYQVSGYACAARIGRYCSIAEDVQIGRQNHPIDWASTSPAFYLGAALFDVGDEFTGAGAFHADRLENPRPPVSVRVTTLGHDVWIGHGAYINAGVHIGDGAVVAARSVVTRDVPPYAIVAGNPATVRKYRLPEALIAPMQDSAWWRFAPWQLRHLDASDPAGFIKGVAQMAGTGAFRPDIFDMRQAAP